MELIGLTILLLLIARTAGLTAGLCFAVFLGGLWFSLAPEQPVPNKAVVHQAPDTHEMVTSKACRSCHPGAWSTWHRSYHRTMTQSPSAAAVLGDFDSLFSDGSVEWQLEANGDDFFVTMNAEGQASKRAQIALLTGSHHLQNYWMDLGDGWLIQFPWAWWVDGSRWIPVRDSFLQPPTTQDRPQVWNDSCIYCHTTKGIRGAARDAAQTQSSVGELGIACEACHGSALKHAEQARSPLGRYFAWLDPPAESNIVNPGNIGASADGICGQCHGVFAHRSGRARDTRGDGYQPGQDIEKTQFFLRLRPSPIPGALPMLAAITPKAAEGLPNAEGCLVTGISPDGLLLNCALPTAGEVRFFVGEVEYGGIATSRANQTQITFRNWRAGLWRQLLDQLGFRGVELTPYDWDAFWRDGTVRTVGREYNGLKASACSTELRCISCHSMHTEDPNDQLKAGFRGDKACVECHSEYVNNPRPHTHHAADSSGSRCQNCHMPHTTYGLIGASRSHRIDAPSPVLMQRLGRPNACSLCHLDRPIQWAEDHMSHWYNRSAKIDDHPSAVIPAGPRWMLEGDAAVRAIVTWHLGWTPSIETSEVKRWGAPYMREVLNDEYAAVRGIAEQVVKDQDHSVTYDYNANSDIRVPQIEKAVRGWQSQSLMPIGNNRLIDGQGKKTRRYRDLRSSRDNRPVRIAE